MGSTIRAHEPAAITPKASPQMNQSQSLATGQPYGHDVSAYQGNVDWQTTAANGAQFVYIKASEGTGYLNSYFAQQYNGSASVGMIRGAYHFALPDTSSGVTQANYFVDHGGGWSADGKTLPPMLDIEYNPYGPTCYGLSTTGMSSWIRAFSNTVFSRTGRYPTIYTSTNWWNTCTGSDPSFGSTNPLFIANYASSPGPMPAGWAYQTFWQYSDSGIFPGDADVFNGSTEQLTTFARGSSAAAATKGNSVPATVNGGGAPTYSPDQRFRVTMQTDGNLVVYDANNVAQWVSGTYLPGSYLRVQPDGNVVVYDSEDNYPQWTAAVYSPGASLMLQDDGNLVLYSTSGVAQWDSRGFTGHRSLNFIPRRGFTHLNPGEAVRSWNGLYTLTMGPNGNVVETRSDGSPMWSTGTFVANSTLRAQPDGNMVVYGPTGAAIWNTTTWWSPGAQAVIQNDGNVVIYDTAWRALWDSMGFTGRQGVLLQ